MDKYRVKNWSNFQHYKDRKPAWIKLHRDILDDYSFQTMPDASRALAPCIWLLASEYEGGEIPADHTMLAFRFRRTEKEINEAIKPLIDRGFLHLVQNASKPLADCKQDAMPEKEEEREKEEEKKGAKKRATPIPADFALDDGLREYATNRWLDPDRECEKFRAYYEANEKPHKNWRAAFQKWCIKAAEFAEKDKPRGGLGVLE